MRTNSAYREIVRRQQEEGLECIATQAAAYQRIARIVRDATYQPKKGWQAVRDVVQDTENRCGKVLTR